MSRTLKIAAAQVGAVHRWSKREETLQRLIALLEEAASKGAQLVVYPETTLTTFFPRYLFTDDAELESYYESGDDITSNPSVAPLFAKARELMVDISVGYAEKTSDGSQFNTCIYYSGRLGAVVSKYRKSHLPGTADPFPEPDAVQQLEKRYFREGDTGFKAFRVSGLVPDALKKSSVKDQDPSTVEGKGDAIMGMLICNDRRWPEAWRVYGLQGVELIMCGYNSPGWAPQLWGFAGKRPLTPERARQDSEFSHKLVMQANSYMNSCFSISAARAGLDDDKFHLIGGSCIVDPYGYVVASAQTEGDEVVFAEIDLDQCRPGKETTFNFGKHRRTDLYDLIVQQKGVVEPDLLD
ncbi:N-carbamoyl-D-amino acid hydrolase [Xylariales sp. PMI_506]|nr:N-carbamoyl-D-amino acid hydrolase [Xylariales sp. PMI_506]